MRRHFLWAALTVFLVPYVGTLGWTGAVHGEELRYEHQKGAAGGIRILLDRTSGAYYMDMEEYLPGVIARQMPIEYELEALKAQAVIARTYICRQLESFGDGTEIPESALDMDYTEADQLKQLWGTSSFPGYYQKLEQAVRETSGVIMTYEGKAIDPMFCRASAGMTRAGDFAHPYLQPVDCPLDMEAEGFQQFSSFTGEEGARAVNGIPEGGEGPRQVKAQDFPAGVQIISRDGAGYVEQIQIGGFLFGGEEIQYALGLSSACFSMEAYGEGFRAVSKGIGHGYGLSQHTANEKAKEGWRAEDILGYFYKNIALISE